LPIVSAKMTFSSGKRNGGRGQVQRLVRRAALLLLVLIV
jgi:hypothetical protein